MADWKMFGNAATDARALGLVDAALFTDRRAGEPIFIANEADVGEEARVTACDTPNRNSRSTMSLSIASSRTCPASQSPSQG